MNGFINLKKERGMTSFKCVAAVRKILGEKKTGHGGTLDPEATGVLPVCLGSATKLCDMLTDKDKVYENLRYWNRYNGFRNRSGFRSGRCIGSDEK